MRLLRERERAIVAELKAMEETCPNGRDYERQHEFVAAYDAWQERRAQLEQERHDVVQRHRKLRDLDG